MLSKSVYLEEMDAFTYRERIKEDAFIFIPVGAFEQHGPHMAMCVDAVLTKQMAASVAEQVGGLVAAPISYGYKSQQRSGGGYHLSGTTSLSAATLIGMVKDIAINFVQHGARKIVFMNGHYENYQFIYEGVDLALADLRKEGIVDAKFMLMSYWDFVDDETIDQLYPDGFTGWDLEHAGVMETSLMLLFYPDLVDMTKVIQEPPADMPNYDVLPIRPDYTPASGCLSCAAEASAEKGKILKDVATKNMVGAVLNEFTQDRA